MIDAYLYGLQEIMEIFQRIWSVVVTFPNLTVTVSNE